MEINIRAMALKLEEEEEDMTQNKESLQKLGKANKCVLPSSLLEAYNPVDNFRFRTFQKVREKNLSH